MLYLLSSGALVACAQEATDPCSALLPKPAELRWVKIPWRTNLMRARADAQKLGKPLFIWVMDGHVLGST